MKKVFAFPSSHIPHLTAQRQHGLEVWDCFAVNSNFELYPLVANAEKLDSQIKTILLTLDQLAVPVFPETRILTLTEAAVNGPAAQIAAGMQWMRAADIQPKQTVFSMTPTTNCYFQRTLGHITDALTQIDGPTLRSAWLSGVALAASRPLYELVNRYPVLLEWLRETGLGNLALEGRAFAKSVYEDLIQKNWISSTIHLDKQIPLSWFTERLTPIIGKALIAGLFFFGETINPHYSSLILRLPSSVSLENFPSLRSLEQYLSYFGFFTRKVFLTVKLTAPRKEWDEGGVYTEWVLKRTVFGFFDELPAPDTLAFKVFPVKTLGGLEFRPLPVARYIAPNLKLPFDPFQVQITTSLSSPSECLGLLSNGLVIR